MISPAREYPDPSSDVDEDYEASLETIREIYSQLPENWRVLYAKEIIDSIQPEEILASDITRICQSLGMAV
jgi:L-rhamnose isomerase